MAMAGTYSFVYSTDSTFATSSSTPAQNKTNNALDVVWATVNGLSASTTYYYYLTGTTGGTATGAHMRFYTDTLPFLFENNGGDAYGNGYAELNGKVSGFPNPVALSFKYGLTPAMGTTTASDVPNVSDANTHYFKRASANINLRRTLFLPYQGGQRYRLDIQRYKRRIYGQPLYNCAGITCYQYNLYNSRFTWHHTGLSGSYKD